jgi:hypothetical protein
MPQEACILDCRSDKACKQEAHCHVHGNLQRGATLVECGGPSFANFSALVLSNALCEHEQHERKPAYTLFYLFFSAWQVAEKYEPMIQAKYAEAEKEIKKKIG